jgi:hypothetical protein
MPTDDVLKKLSQKRSTPLSQIKRLSANRAKDDKISGAGYAAMVKRAEEEERRKKRDFIRSTIMPYIPTTIGRMSPGEYKARFGGNGGMLSSWVYSPGTEETFSPIDISGLEVWYDASQIIGLNDADPVTTWPNSSSFGSDRDVTQATAASRPTYRMNVLNGKPVVRFDGANDWLYLFTGLMPEVVQPMTWFFVARTTRFPDTADKQAILSAGGGTLNLIEFGQHAANYDIYAGASIGFTNPAPIIGTFTEFMWLQNGAASQFCVNGAEPTTVDTGTNKFAAGGEGFSIGSRNRDNSSEPLEGDIAEIMLYSRALSDSEREQVEDYLMTKYAIV